ncbi:small terminase protein [uncultured Caudovirales phage]|uniref:Small terminase protein n=1 Tax=uncultured Caudovirales phage TaxID=2100421 RepID=A0A6J5T533_9CAUD|nr:small terminase protein [uncultured Caudovirales phage]
MSKFEESMSNIFDVVPIVKEEKPLVVKNYSNQANLDQDLTDAYQQSRDNLQDVIDQGKDALDDILRIAKESEQPRAFEVFGTLLKNVVEANKELITMQKQMREMDSNIRKESNTNVIDKAIFVGSTKELQSLLKGE